MSKHVTKMKFKIKVPVKFEVLTAVTLMAAVERSHQAKPTEHGTTTRHR
jgi:6,7-dimethyl-8-ribityllumazine synthase